MTHWTEAADLLEEREERGFVSRYAPGTLAFALSAALGVYLVYFRPLVHVAAPVAETAQPADATVFGGLAPIVPPPVVALTKPAAPAPEANPFGGLETKGFGSSSHFSLAENEVPTPPVPPGDLRAPLTDEGVPLPPRRPTGLASRLVEPPVVARLEAPPVTRPAAPAATPGPQAPGLLEKLFGGNTNAAKAPSQTLAYAAPPPVAATAATGFGGRGGAAPTGGGFGGFLRGLNFGSSSSPATRYGDHVAVYDISARVVYLPDGTRLEAHSGLGSLRDDPSGVNHPMRGATPPATYALTPREELFHGVAALRLTPIDGSVYGRAGLLAHTYMLGPDGDSNGCVSFRDYDAFLRAYRSGEITKLVVVTRL